MDNIKYPYFDDKIKIEELFLDSRNPRLPDYMKGKSEQEIIAYMLLEESTLELMQAIGENGYFPGEQLLVIPRIGGGYTAVEGNRRLTSVKLLNNPNIAGEIQKSLVDRVQENAEYKTFETLPCMVFEKEEDIHDYLGYRHITGVQPWNLKQKANYLNYLREKNFSSLDINQASDELRKMIGSKRDYVKRVLIGYDIYNKIRENRFFDIKDLDEKGFYFTYIADSLRHANIVSYLGVKMESNDYLSELKIQHLKNWTTWLYQPIEIKGRITTRLKGKSQDLNDLNIILGNEEAKKQFIENDATLKEALSYTEAYDKIFEESVNYALNSLNKAKSITTKVNSFYTSLEDDLREIIKISRTIKADKDELNNDPLKDGNEF